MPRSHSTSADAGTIRVRRATRNDLETLFGHRQRMWTDMGTYSRRQVAAAGPRSRAWIRTEVRAGRYLGFVAETPSGAVAGSGAIWLHPVQPFPGPRPRPDAPYILSMYTVPEFRGRGVARRLVREMIRWARRRGYRRITLHASKQGGPVYRAVGFVETNEMRYNLIGFGGVPASSPAAPSTRRKPSK